MAQSTQGMDGIEAVQNHNYPEVVQPPAGAKEAYGYGYGSPQQPQPPVAAAPPEKTICGLRRTTFLLLALLLLVIIAAAVGGGVGGSIAVRDAYDRGRLEEATANAGGGDNESGGRIKAPPSKGLLELDCPGIDGNTEQIDLDGTRHEFTTNCDIDRPSGAGGTDIMRLPAYSYHDCLTACAAFNEEDSVNGTKCEAAHFNANLLTDGGGNCWLKSKKGDKKVTPEGDRKNIKVTGDAVRS